MSLCLKVFNFFYVHLFGSINFNFILKIFAGGWLSSYDFRGHPLISPLILQYLIRTFKFFFFDFYPFFEFPPPFIIYMIRILYEFHHSNSEVNASIYPVLLLNFLLFIYHRFGINLIFIITYFQLSKAVTLVNLGLFNFTLSVCSFDLLLFHYTSNNKLFICAALLITR